MLIAIDDIHWLDAESGRFVAYLAQRLEGQPVLLAGDGAAARARRDGELLDVFRDWPRSSHRHG